MNEQHEPGGRGHAKKREMENHWWVLSRMALSDQLAPVWRINCDYEGKISQDFK